MPEPDRIQDFLRRLTPLARNNLLTELERLETCGDAVHGFATVVEKLRMEFRKDGQTHNRLDNPARYFFAPLDRCSSMALPSTPMPAGYCAVRYLRSGNGSAEICCRR